MYRTVLFPIVSLIGGCAAAAWGMTEQRDMPDDEALQQATTPVPLAEAWWQERHRTRLELAKRGGATIQVVFLGDSITQGWEEEGRDLWNTHFAPVRALNLGFSGDRTEHVLWRIANGEVDGISPRVVVLLIGTNNAGHRQEAPAVTATAIRAIVEDLRSRLPDSKILLLGVLPRGATPDAADRRLVDETTKRIRELADETHVWFADLASAFLDDQGNLLLQAVPDGLHPNTAGYQLFADALLPHLRPLWDTPPRK